MRGISAGLTGSGLQLLLAVAQSPADREQLEHYLTGQHVDGVLLVSLHGIDTLPARLESRGVPTVLGGRPLGERPVACVDADNRGGARQAVEHLVAGGRRRIATIPGPQDMTVGQERHSGYLDGLAGAGLPRDDALVEPGDFSLESGTLAAERLLARGPGPGRAVRGLGRDGDRGDAGAAGGGAGGAAGRGRGRVRGLAGRAAHRSAADHVHQPVEAMGREMVRLLRLRIGGGTLPEPLVILPTHLVVRGSA